MKRREYVRTFMVGALALMMLAVMPGNVAFAGENLTTAVIADSGQHITVDGSVIVAGQPWAVNVYAYGTGEDKDASVKVNGDIELAAGDFEGTGVSVQAKTGNASAEITGKLTMLSRNSAYGVSQRVFSKGDIRLSTRVGGEIQVRSIEKEAVGLDANAGSAEVGGHITAQGIYATGVQSYNRGKDTVIDVKRGISATGDDIVTGADLGALDEGSNLKFTVGNGIAASLTGSGDVNRVRGISIGSTNGNIVADIGGDVLAKSDLEDTAGIENGVPSEDAEYSPQGKTTIRVHGNLHSDGVGILNTIFGSKTPTDILVENELIADKVGVLIKREPPVVEVNTAGISPEPELSLTTWRIKPNERGNVAEYSVDLSNYPEGTLPAGFSREGCDEGFEKSINYIIKGEQPANGGTFSLVNEEGKALEKSYDFDVAHEGDKVMLKAEPGYSIVAAYNGKEEKVPLQKDEKGNYYIVVPKGGGVYLSADLKKDVKPDPTPTPTPEATPTPTPSKTSGTALAKVTTTKNSMTIGWNKIQGADGYDIFFAKCSDGKKEGKCKKVKTIKGNKTFSWTKKGLKKKNAYKAYVRAYVYKNGKKTYVSKTPMFHAYTGNGTKNYTNAKSVTFKNVKKGKLSLQNGKTFKIKAKVNKVNKKKKLMPKSHAPTLRYMTSNSKVATVSKSGKITAKGKGTCYIYVYAHNGISKKVKVTVK